MVMRVRKVRACVKERATAAWWATAKAREREWVRAKGRVYVRERINEVRWVGVRKTNQPVSHLPVPTRE